MRKRNRLRAAPLYFAVKALICTGATLCSSYGLGSDEVPAEKPRSLISHFGATIGGSEVFGTLADTGAGLQSRNMLSTFGDGMIGYRVGSYLLGLGLSYYQQEQLTSLGNAGGTNLRGSALLYGLGAKYTLNDRWSLQATLDLIGNYTLGRQTFASEDDGFRNPLGLTLKAQYYFFQQIPLSLDFELGYIRYGTLRVTSTDYSNPATNLLAGLGLTWHFGDQRSSDEAVVSKELPIKETAVVETPATPPQTATQDVEKKLGEFADVKKTDRGLMVNLSGDISFGSAKSELSPKAKEIIQKTAFVLNSMTNAKVRVEGHSDSSGKSASNQKLSQARAESVKSYLVASGLDAANVEAKGFGSEKPIADNKTKVGRATNRRVEIYIEQTH